MKTQRTVDRLDMSLRGEWNEWDTLVQAGPAIVDIEYEYEPGQKLIQRSDPNDSQEGFPARVSICRVSLAAELHFAGEVSESKFKAGTKLWDSLTTPLRTERISPSQVEQLEDEILKGMASCEPDYAEAA